MFNSHLEFRRSGGSQLSPGAEPMTLGSPAASPNSPQKNYLPPILMGEVPLQTSPQHIPVGGWSTPQPKHVLSFSTPQMSPITTRTSLYPSPAVQNAPMINSPSIRKPGAPPVESLFDTFSTQDQPGSDLSKADDPTQTISKSFNLNDRSSLDYRQANGVLTPSMSFNGTSNTNSNFVSPAQIDPFYTQGEALTLNSQLDETWITIFGFPPAATNYILQQFSQYGKITEHKLTTSGNWIHVRYQSKLQAKKALSKNGKVFSGDIMVGVKPCIEMDLMNDCGKENSTVVDTSVNFCQGNTENEFFDSTKRTLAKIRPLTQMYKTPTSDSEITPKAKNEPKSLITKAREYLNI